MSCRNVAPINRNVLGVGPWPMVHRTSFDGCNVGRHGGQHTEEYNSTFYNACNRFANLVNSRSPTNWVVSTIGDVGVTVCKAGFHGEGRAFDLTAVNFTNGSVIDMNVHWNPSAPCGGGTLFRRRQYIGVVAAARSCAGTVLTAWYNADHRNHIHFDNGVGVVPIRTNVRTDATMVQAACNLLNGESLVIDGVWGSLTEAAYRRLLTRLRMQCRNPKANTAHAVTFLELLAQTGLHGVAAGQFTDLC